MLPNEPAPLPYEAIALPDAPPTTAVRTTRAEHLRRIAAVALVGGLAAAWFVTTRLGGGDAPVAAPPAEVPASVARPFPPIDAMLRRLPVGAQCHDQDGSGGRARCSVAGIDVEYRLLGADALRPAYLAGAGDGSDAASAGSRTPVCALGAEEERSWSRPTAPAVAVGRYACRVEQGRAAMWWTDDDRGLLAHAIAANGDLASLFVWWDSHAER